MRVTPTDLAALTARLAPLDTDEVRNAYRRRDPRINNIEKVIDIDRRYRWDLYSFAHGWDVLGGSYADAHIDTALRRIVRPL